MTCSAYDEVERFLYENCVPLELNVSGISCGVAQKAFSVTISGVIVLRRRRKEREVIQNSTARTRLRYFCVIPQHLRPIAAVSEATGVGSG